MRSKPDIWMPLYIGDYLADTAHLDAERHGCYLLWMMHYWRKGPLSPNVDDLVAIGRLRGTDAPSIAQALLKEFFTMRGDGLWHQKRMDEELAKWNSKSKKAKEKAKKAAKARWENDAPSIAPSNAPSNASGNQQAMLEQCPLPLPISTRTNTFSPAASGDAPSIASSTPTVPNGIAAPFEWPQVPDDTPPAEPPKEPKPPKPPTKTQLVDQRHADFKEAILHYWESKNPGIEMPWDGAEGKQLGMWLKSAPKTTLEQFTRFLRNRFRSNVNHSERPSLWIRNVTNYATHPLSRFKIPQDANDGSPPQQKVKILSRPTVLKGGSS